MTLIKYFSFRYFEKKLNKESPKHRKQDKTKIFMLKMFNQRKQFTERECNKNGHIRKMEEA